MGFIKFYGMVFREAFRHSLDIAQTIIFVSIILGGLIVTRSPASRPLIDSLNLGGWQMAAISLGAIITFRLIFEPYWLWKSAQSRIVEKPENAIDWGLRVEGCSFGVDKKNKAVQVGFVLKNSLDAPVRYEVVDIQVNIEDKGVENPGFDSRGSIISRSSQTTFYYPFIFGVQFNGSATEGIASITFKYGVADKKFAREAKYVLKIFNPGRVGSKYHLLEEDERNI